MSPSQSIAERLNTESPFATGQSKCAWQDDSSCSFVQPSDSFKIILYVAIFSTIISAPVEYVLNSIILLVLARPPRSSKVAAAENFNIDPIPEITNSALSPESPEVLDQMAKLTHAIQAHRRKLSPELCSEFDGTSIIVYIL
jgi:hypothetical protein